MMHDPPREIGRIFQGTHRCAHDAKIVEAIMICYNPPVERRPYMAKRKVLISFLMDRTGSMAQIWGPTIEGFNSYLREVKNQDTFKADWDLTIFDSESIDTIRERVKTKDMKKLKPDEFYPRAMTPLNDAIAKTVLTAKKRGKKYDGVVVVILTDGYENASQEYSKEGVAKLIQKQEKKGWQFIFLGADMDAQSEALSYGIKRGATVTASSDANSVGETYTVAAGATVAYASTGTTVSGHADTRSDGDDEEDE